MFLSKHTGGHFQHTPASSPPTTALNCNFTALPSPSKGRIPPGESARPLGPRDGVLAQGRGEERALTPSLITVTPSPRPPALLLLPARLSLLALITPCSGWHPEESQRQRCTSDLR